MVGAEGTGTRPTSRLGKAALAVAISGAAAGIVLAPALLFADGGLAFITTGNDPTYSRLDSDPPGTALVVSLVIAAAALIVLGTLCALVGAILGVAALHRRPERRAAPVAAISVGGVGFAINGFTTLVVLVVVLAALTPHY